MENSYIVRPVKNKKNIRAQVPGSKSITNRALLLAALGKGKSCLSSVLFSDDSRVFMKALEDLGLDIKIDEKNERVWIDGCGGLIPKPQADVYVGSAGTAARFLTAILGLSKGRYHLRASEQMSKRPMKELLLALESIGSQIEYEGEPYHFPFTLGMGEKNYASSVKINIDKSSQFLSALLISSVLLPDNFTIEIEGSHGMKYVDMTLNMMEQFGGPKYQVIDKTVVTSSGFSYQAMNYLIEPDLSAAAYFYGMGALLGVNTIVENVHFDSMQGDIAFLDVLKSMGCKLEDTPDGIQLIRFGKELQGGEFDLSSFSDQALTLSVIAAFAKGITKIQNVGHIKFQECDRLEAILTNLHAMGIKAEESDGTITITGGSPKGAVIETFEDHRVAMSFAMAGVLIDGVEILNPSCCSKTFEHYFDCLEKYV